MVTFMQIGKRNRNHPNCDLLDDLEDLARDLAPDNDYLRAGREAAQDIFEHLKQNGYRYGIKIGRTKIAGSVGKGTGISYEDDEEATWVPDFDLVVFVIDKSPPFDSVLNQFMKLLREVREIKSIYKTSISVQLIYDHPEEGEIHFDLLPAENHAKDTTNVDDVAEEEAHWVLQRLSTSQMYSLRNGEGVDPEENRLQSSGLCETAVKFVSRKVEHKFVLHVVRLAKYWNANIDLGNTYVSARSSMIEMVAICAQQGENYDNLISGFERFLRKMESFGTLFITLGATNTHKRVASLMSKHRKTVILDPSNPFNNLAHGLQQDVVDEFEFQAETTLKVLKNMGRRGRYESVEDPIDCIFCHKAYYGKKGSRHR